MVKVVDFEKDNDTISEQIDCNQVLMWLLDNFYENGLRCNVVAENRISVTFDEKEFFLTIEEK